MRTHLTRPRLMIAFLGAAWVAGILLSTACGGGSWKEVERFRGLGVGFDYPGDWELEIDEEPPQRRSLWRIDLLPGGRNVVTIGGYHVPQAVTAANLGSYRRELAEFLGTGGPLTRVTVAGLPGYSVTDLSRNGEFQVRSTIFFRRVSRESSSQFVVLCQVDRDDSKDTRKGCEQVLNTFVWFERR